MPTDHEARQIKFYDRRLGRVFLHPSSCCFSSGSFPTGWLVYSELVQTAKAYVREASMVPIYPLLLFGGEMGREEMLGGPGAWSGGVAVRLAGSKWVATGWG